MLLCRGGKIAGEGASQTFDPKELGGMLKQNVPDYLNICYYHRKKVKTLIF